MGRTLSPHQGVLWPSILALCSSSAGSTRRNAWARRKAWNRQPTNRTVCPHHRTPGDRVGRGVGAGLGPRKSSFHLYTGRLALPPHFQSRFQFLRVAELLGSLPAKPVRAAHHPARMHYLVPRSQLPSQAPSTPPLVCPRSLSLSHPHLPPARKLPGPQVRTTAGFHAPRRPTSSGEGKGRRGPGLLPDQCPRCVRTPRVITWQDADGPGSTRSQPGCLLGFPL